MGVFFRKNKKKSVLDKIFTATCTMFNELSEAKFQLEATFLLPILHGISSAYIAMVSNDPAPFLRKYDEILNEKLSEMNVSPETRTQLLEISNGAYATACETAEKIIATNKNIQADQLFVISASQTLCEAVGTDEPDTMLDIKMMEFYYYLHEAVS